MTNSRYLVPKKRFRQELEVKHSRFICDIEHTTNKDESRAFVDAIKAEFPDATHHCWAFQNGPPGDSRDIGYSDDGEPHGTAGKPMLNVISHAEVGELTAVVTRYFGGTKLGTGGLSRAYGDAVKITLQDLPIQIKINYVDCQLQTSYQYWSAVEKLLKQHQAVIENTEFSDSISAHIKLDQSLLDSYLEQFTNITHGSGIMKVQD